MADEPHSPPPADGSPQAVAMPAPTAAPLVLGLGVALLLGGVALGTAFIVVGAALFAAGLGLWVVNWLPGRGHTHEPLVEPARRAPPVAGAPGRVEELRPGLPGYRMQLPLRVHPISAGVKGGIVGGLVIPLPALVYGLVSGHGIWYPVNLLAGMVLPGLEEMSVAELEQFNLLFLVIGIIIHAIMSVVMGLLYGVLLPTLPDIPKPLAWGGLLMPLLWTGTSFCLMGLVNPVLQRGVDWPSFIFSQFVFGVVAALVVMRVGQSRPVAAGILGGIAGGLLMPVPAVLWALATGHGVWYPVNLLAGMVEPGIGDLPAAQLERFHAGMFTAALAIHAALSVGFGLVYGLLLPKLPPIPGPMSWGGMLMPLLWTGASFGLMGVVNPVLQQRVDWPWFVVSQFIFGVAASVVVVRTQTIPVPPAGPGVDPPTGPRAGGEP
jgi:hypothetical protein